MQLGGDATAAARKRTGLAATQARSIVHHVADVLLELGKDPAPGVQGTAEAVFENHGGIALTPGLVVEAVAADVDFSCVDGGDQHDRDDQEHGFRAHDNSIGPWRRSGKRPIIEGR